MPGSPAELLEGGRLAALDAVAQVDASVVSGGPAHGCRAIDVRVAGGIDLRILPDRGLDLGSAWFGGVPLAWRSAVGERAPFDAPSGADWLDGFGGGLVATCGLRNVGAASEGHGLHGRISHVRASAVTVERALDGGEAVVTIRGVLDEVSALGPHLRMERTITTRTGSGDVSIADRVTNLGAEAEPAPLLYHVNLGAPLLGPATRVEIAGTRPEPRDDAASRAGWERWAAPGGAVAGAEEIVLEHAYEDAAAAGAARDRERGARARGHGVVGARRAAAPVAVDPPAGGGLRARSRAGELLGARAGRRSGRRAPAGARAGRGAGHPAAGPGRRVLIAGPNLTIDRTLTGGELRPGEVLRFAAAAGPGGKGLNVARGAQALGAAATLVGFLPGHTGTAVGAMIADEGIRLLGVPCGGEVRSTAVILEPGRSTVINEHGTEILPADWERFEERVAGELQRHAVLVCSGSLPPGAPADAYARLAARAREHGVRCLVDAAGPVVGAALAARPDLVAPNLAEAEAALGAGDGIEPVEVPPDAQARAMAAAAALVGRGARAAIVTAAAAGAALAAGDGGVAWLPAAAVTVRNPIGAGDALLAGLAAALEAGDALPDAARAGIAAAGAAVEDERPGRFDPARARALREQGAPAP